MDYSNRGAITDQLTVFFGGFARIISDYATTFYLADLIIDPEYQHQGLGTALVSYAISRLVYQGLRGILLTKNAHGL